MTRLTKKMKMTMKGTTRMASQEKRKKTASNVSHRPFYFHLIGAKLDNSIACRIQLLARPQGSLLLAAAETAPPSKKRKTTIVPVEDAPVAEDEQDEEPAELEENDENGDAKEEAEEVSDDKVEATTEPLKAKVTPATTATEVEGGEEELVAANGDEED